MGNFVHRACTYFICRKQAGHGRFFFLESGILRLAGIYTFPQLEYGLAYNIWGDIWASGGWVALILFIFFYHIVLVLGNLLIKHSSGYSLVIIALFFSIWAFIYIEIISYFNYIYKNEY